MGTRHLICVVVAGEYKVAQYGQWDGYPSGQGETVCEFIQTSLIKNGQLEAFTKAVRKCSFWNPEELDAEWVRLAGPSINGMVKADQADKFYDVYPELSRDMGAEVLDAVLNSGGLKLKNSLDFAADSLFCEYVYVLDLDHSVLEIYQGFNQAPLGPLERFAELPKDKKPDGTDSDYYPVKRLASYHLAEATPAAMEVLEARLNKEAEAEEVAQT